ncbi:MAG: hypothetical protein WCO19_04205 [Candidatus Saccharibacteria bacterium]
MDYFERKLDEKNRLTIPKELQAEFGSEVVITRGFKQYLHLYPKRIWDQHMEPALTGNILDERTADLNVQFRTGKVTAKLDKKQGRITLEPHHLKYAKIKRDIVAVRAGSYWRISAL